MHSIDFLQQKITKAIAAESFSFKPKELYDPIAYTLSMGGKRIRPLLTVLACDLYGGDIEGAMNPAIGIEIFHNFTLVHDDIMDNAPLRRSKKTVFKKWNTNIAVLSGDTMFALAYTYVTKTKKENLPELLELFSNTAVKVCEGQQYDLNFETQKHVVIGEYLRMIELKTAVLIGAALAVGALIAGAKKAERDKLYNFGVNVGMAFQLMDDLLDVYSDEKKFGKVCGGDIVTNKKTFLYLKAFERAKGKTLKELKTAFLIHDNQEKINKIKSLYNILDVKECTLKEMRKYHSNALQILKTMKLDESKKKILKLFADKLMNRDL